MNPEKYLGQLYKLNNLIQSDKEELEEIRSLATSISNDISQERVQTSTSNDKMTDIIAKIVDLENEIKEEIKNFINLKKEVRDVINQVKNVDERLFLRYRYINFYQWKSIISAMKCSNTQIQRIRDKALQSVEQILQNRNKTEQLETNCNKL